MSEATRYTPNGYKQTDIGPIPDNWNAISINNLIDTNAPIRYGVVQVGQHTDTGIPVVAIKFVKNIARAPLHRTAVHLEMPYVASRVKSGDVLISIKGTIGRVGIVPPGFFGNISRDLARIRPSDNISSQYLAQQLESDNTQNRIFRAVVGTTRLELSIAALRQFEIPVPPTLAEQEAISDALSDADALIESLEQLLVKKRDIRQGTIQELLTGKERLPGFTASWNLCEVEDVISSHYSGPSPTCEERNVDGEKEWGILKTTASTWENGWDWTKHKTLPRTFWNLRHLEVRKGDVIVTKAGPRHRVGVTSWVNYCPLRIIASGKMIGLRPNPAKVVPLMLAAAISAKEAQRFLDQRTTGMAESQVNFENAALLRTPIRLPHITEQAAIATIVSDLDAQIAAIEMKLSKARQIKRGMMQVLLAGRVRLNSPTVAEIPMDAQPTKERATASGHNQHFNEAVVIAVLAQRFGNEQYPLGRFRRTKLSYLLHRRAECDTPGFRKKAAGPYNPTTRYGGAEKIALKNEYVRECGNGKYDGFVAAESIREAQEYFDNWYKSGTLEWLDQFRFKTNDELELLTTTDMSIQDILRAGGIATVQTVKKLIASHSEWKAKLEKVSFSDANIQRALQTCDSLFAYQESVP